VYPQKPMVKSRVLDLVHFDALPGGCNATLAVMSYSGYDIEDAIVLNRASLDRGFMRCLVIKRHQVSIRRYANGACDRTTGPPSIELFLQGADDARYKRYSALDNDGICRVGEKLHDQSIMINREMPVEDRDELTPALPGRTGRARSLTKTASMSYKAQPCTYKSPAPSVVDRVLLTANETDQFLVKVMVRQCRRPEVGDKFASRHGQKGVCGAIVSQEDMPFSDTGVCPDVIMNPHGFPSRMTVGKIIELVYNPALACIRHARIQLES